MFIKFLAMLISALSFFSCYASSHALYIKGTVTINKKPLDKSKAIKAGDIISTFKDSLVLIQLDTGATIKINENSSLKISIHKPKTNTTLVQLIKGSSFFRKDPKIKGKFNVKTKVATMGVRGTQFFVAYGQELSDDVFMCVNKGSVWVSADKKKATIVKEGEGINITKESIISQPRFLPWTKDLNWSLNPKSKTLENDASIEEKYGDPLDQDYD